VLLRRRSSVFICDCSSSVIEPGDRIGVVGETMTFENGSGGPEDAKKSTAEEGPGEASRMPSSKKGLLQEEIIGWVEDVECKL
jgi:hypothetical protein